MKHDTELCERAEFINVKGEVEIGLLRIVPRVPGRPKNDMPREVCISSAPAPNPKVK